MSIKNLEFIANLKTVHQCQQFKARATALWLAGKIGSELYFEARRLASHQMFILKKSARAIASDWD